MTYIADNKNLTLQEYTFGKNVDALAKNRVVPRNCDEHSEDNSLSLFVSLIESAYSYICNCCNINNYDGHSKEFTSFVQEMKDKYGEDITQAILDKPVSEINSKELLSEITEFLKSAYDVKTLRKDGLTRYNIVKLVISKVKSNINGVDLDDLNKQLQDGALTEDILEYLRYNRDNHIEISHNRAFYLSYSSIIDYFGNIIDTIEDDSFHEDEFYGPYKDLAPMEKLLTVIDMFNGPDNDFDDSGFGKSIKETCESYYISLDELKVAVNDYLKNRPIVIEDRYKYWYTKYNMTREQFESVFHTIYSVYTYLFFVYEPGNESFDNIKSDELSYLLDENDKASLVQC